MVTMSIRIGPRQSLRRHGTARSASVRTISQKEAQFHKLDKQKIRAAVFNARTVSKPSLENADKSEFPPILRSEQEQFKIVRSHDRRGLNRDPKIHDANLTDP